MRKPRKLTRADWADTAEGWSGRFEGQAIDTGITVLFAVVENPGGGPKLHVHPYDEVFVVRQGRVRYRIGDETIDAEAGDIVMAPAGVPHRFQNLGPGRLESTDIHLSPTFIQTDLEE